MDFPNMVHTERSLSEAERSQRLTPARAAKLRRKAMAECGCWWCVGALTPAATIAEHEARSVVAEAWNAREQHQRGVIDRMAAASDVKTYGPTAPAIERKPPKQARRVETRPEPETRATLARVIDF